MFTRPALTHFLTVICDVVSIACSELALKILFQQAVHVLRLQLKLTEVPANIHLFKVINKKS